MPPKKKDSGKKSQRPRVVTCEAPYSAMSPPLRVRLILCAWPVLRVLSYYSPPIHSRLGYLHLLCHLEAPISFSHRIRCRHPSSMREDLVFLSHRLRCHLPSSMREDLVSLSHRPRCLHLSSRLVSPHPSSGQEDPVFHFYRLACLHHSSRRGDPVFHIPHRCLHPFNKREGPTGGRVQQPTFQTYWRIQQSTSHTGWRIPCPTS